MPADIDSLFGDDDFDFDDSFNDSFDDSFDDEVGGEVADDSSPQDSSFDSMFRETSSRSESYDEVGFDGDDYLDEESSSSGGRGFSLGGFTSFQMIIIMMLVLLDFAAIGFGLLVLMGRIS